jgi:bifunctional UDP-N-acetylglucosamine pyrophosphorylase/glucosamine-1-phosphate N-acetyltransferase
MTLAAIVLAAGKGTRMKSDQAKVLHEVGGRPMVQWVIDHLDELGCDDIVVVVGYDVANVTAALPSTVRTAYQPEQLGTGHAAQVGLAELDVEVGDTVIVISGDMPLISTASLRSLVEDHRRAAGAVTLLSAILDEPRAYGRVVRGEDGAVRAVVEQRDATPDQLAIREVNTSVYAFDAAFLRVALDRLRPDNDQAELYLTDVVGIAAADGLAPGAVVVRDPREALGVNTLDQLAEVTELLAAGGS